MRPFAPPDQERARRLIIEGLGEHFGHVDEHINTDLEDIARSYADGVFLVADAAGRIVGTGALIPSEDAVMQVVRMSTDRRLRRAGIATLVLASLKEHARRLGCTRLILQTVPVWDDAVGFYRSAGFHEARRDEHAVVFTTQL